jgi:hypothetical protein
MMVRHRDGKNLSGTGKVIEGVVFPDGKVVIQWQTDTSSIAIFKNLREFQAVHVKEIFNENEFIWIEGYKPTDEIDGVLDEVTAYVAGLQMPGLTDKVRGTIVAKTKAISRSLKEIRKQESADAQ